MTKPKHGWNSFHDYVSVHDRVIRSKIFSERMVRPKTYTLRRRTDQYYELFALEIMIETYKGTLVRVDIYKDVEVDTTIKSRPRARTYHYSFSANIPKGGRLVRYCGPHRHESPKSPDHHKFHHKHDFTQGVEKVIRIPEDEWPHVDEFLREVLETY